MKKRFEELEDISVGFVKRVFSLKKFFGRSLLKFNSEVVFIEELKEEEDCVI